VMAGTLGAVAATSPAELLLAHMDWRGLLVVLAIATAATAGLIFVVVPDAEETAPSATQRISSGLKGVYGDPRFWRLAPLSTMCISAAWAIQGLWAAPWLGDVAGLGHTGIVSHLFVMAVSLSAGALLLGVGMNRLRLSGVRPQAVFCAVAVLLLCAEGMLVTGVRTTSYGPWAVIGGVGSATVLSYSILAEYFEKEISGRANGALNFFHISGAFVLQELIGAIVDRWPGHDGHYPPIAYKTALAIIIALQVAALLWFARLDLRLVALVPKLAKLHKPKELIYAHERLSPGQDTLSR